MRSNNSSAGARSSYFEVSVGNMNFEDGCASKSDSRENEYERFDWNKIVQENRQRLRRMVEFRMSPQLRSRVDASDVVQDTLIEAARVLSESKHNTDIPVHVWLRRLANQKLIQAHRAHRAARRDAGREQQAGDAGMNSSMSIARFLVGNMTSPSNAAIRDEKKRSLTEALDRMGDLDREVLILRHFEQLTSRQSAEILGLNVEAVKKRYIRALEKLQQIMAELTTGS